MSIQKSGFKELRAKLRRVVPLAEEKAEQANQENAEDVAAVSRLLIPEKNGIARGSIRTFPWPEGGYAIDFGPLSRIIEGGTEERFTSEGEGRGRSPAQPFVNPAFGATRSRRRARNRLAVKEALEQADG